MRVIAVDMDGVLFEPNDVNNVSLVQELCKMRENLVIVYTARGEWSREKTERQLKELDVPYHLLVMGKLKADYYVDDRCVGLKELVRICKGESMGEKVGGFLPGEGVPLKPKVEEVDFFEVNRKQGPVREENKL